MYFGITLQGGQELDRKLREMEPKVANKLIKSGMKRALQPIRAAAVMNALNMIGGGMGTLISENIIIKGLKKRKGQYGMGVMIRPGVNAFVHITKIGVRHYIPAAIEYGHAAPYTHGTNYGGKVGSDISKIDREIAKNAAKTVPAKPFMRNAVDSQKDKTIEIASKEIREAIEG